MVGRRASRRGGEVGRRGGDLGRKKQTLNSKFIARPHFSRLSNWVAAAVVLSAMIPSVAVLTILLLPA